METTVVSNDKTNNLIMNFLSFTQGKLIHRLRKYSTSEAVEPPSRGIFGKNEFYGILEEATQKQGMIGLEVGNFLRRLAGLVFRVK